jgi:hypothetical protein
MHLVPHYSIRNRVLSFFPPSSALHFIVCRVPVFGCYFHHHLFDHTLSTPNTSQLACSERRFLSDFQMTSFNFYSEYGGSMLLQNIIFIIPE